MSVLLLNMPFAQLCWGNLGLSLLKSGLTAQGIDCELKNLCFPFAERVGYELYDWLAARFAFVLGGEHLFAKEYFADRLPSTEQFWNDVLLWTEPELDAQDKADYQTVAAAVRPFLDDCLQTIDWSAYSFVGFTTSYQQTFPSLCLAQKIKERFPNIKTVFGGAACEGIMGRELLRQFPEMDYVFIGEADLTFPRFIKEWKQENQNGSSLPDGVLCRENIDSFCELHPAQLQSAELERLMPPDFDDYFSELERSPLRNNIHPYLFCETSRGCWWGERRQCSFCGLNGNSLRFRCKSPDKVIEELAYLTERYGNNEVCFSDNILAKEYFDSLLPKLKDSGLNIAFEFEMKTNQKKEQVSKLLDAGLGAAQLGIETFSTPILKMLSKGATARHNLQMLKWFTEGGIAVKWNVLYGFPGEEPAEYEKMATFLPLLYHFHPPTAFGRVRIDRFAPYHNNPEKYGIENVRPHRAFRFLYPFDDESLERLSYYHEFDFADGRNVDDYVKPFLESVKCWEAEHLRGTLNAFDREDGVLLLTDTRPVALEFQYRLSGLERELYLFCDAARTKEEIAQRFPQFQSVEQRLIRWLERRIMLFIDERYFALALNRNRA